MIHVQNIRPWFPWFLKFMTISLQDAYMCKLIKFHEIYKAHVHSTHVLCMCLDIYILYLFRVNSFSTGLPKRLQRIRHLWKQASYDWLHHYVQDQPTRSKHVKRESAQSNIWQSWKRWGELSKDQCRIVILMQICTVELFQLHVVHM